ncbi:MAG: tRNA dihydrouridine synthase [Anaerolineae bacterium]
MHSNLDGNNIVARIGSVNLYGDLLLAPMAGYSDQPFRTICRELGSAASIIPCILDDGLLYDSKRTDELLRASPDERPLAIQILSKDEDRLTRASKKLISLNPDWVDLNLGCPAKHIAGRGRGAALLRQPEHLEALARRLVRDLPCPITAKIRLGWDDETRNYREVALRLQLAGVSALAVHGRTAKQSFGGNADWEAIREIRELLTIPVIANGDVRTSADIEAIKKATGCELVMIGRGAVGNPWIFSRLEPSAVIWQARLEMINRHLLLMAEHYGERNGVRLFRKHLIHYVQGFHGAGALRPLLVDAETPTQVMDVLYNWDLRDPAVQRI